jgi:hypothetical protein
MGLGYKRVYERDDKRLTLQAASGATAIAVVRNGAVVDRPVLPGTGYPPFGARGYDFRASAAERCITATCLDPQALSVLTASSNQKRSIS